MAIAVGSRVAALGIGALAVFALGFPPHVNYPSSAVTSPLMNLPARWDTSWYLGLASDGYQWDGVAGRFENIAFFPAYPAVVGTVARLLALTTPASWFWLAAGLSTLLFGAALATLYSLCRRDGGDERANRAVWLCAASPFAVYFGVGYTESLYLLASLCAVLHLERHQYLPAAAWGLLGGLTRPTALVIAAAMLASRLVDQVRWWRGRNEHGVPPMAWLAAISPLLGMAIYSCYVFGVTGHPLMWATVQDGWGRTTQSPVHALSAPLAELVRNPIAMLVATPETVLNLAAAVFALAVAYPLSRRFGVGHGVLVLLGTVMPLVGGGLASAGRYTAVAFPIYVWLAASLSGPQYRAVLVVFGLLQVVVAALFFTWRPLY